MNLFSASGKDHKEHKEPKDPKEPKETKESKESRKKAEKEEEKHVGLLIDAALESTFLTRAQTDQGNCSEVERATMEDDHRITGPLHA